MTRREPHWDELRTFREVMRDGSLSAAARRLGLTQPTVGRHIDALEAALGLALFARSPRGLAPTDAARRLVPLVEEMATASESLARVAAGSIALQLRPESFGFRCDNDLAQLAALRAGVGIGGAQENIARRTPELVRLFAKVWSMSLEVWLVMHEDVSATPRIRRLYEHLAGGLSAYVAGR